MNPIRTLEEIIGILEKNPEANSVALKKAYMLLGFLSAEKSQVSISTIQPRTFWPNSVGITPVNNLEMPSRAKRNNDIALC